MENVRHKSRCAEAGTVGAFCGSGERTQRPDLDFFDPALRVNGGKNFGLRALLRAKANSKLQANESALERLIVYSGSNLLELLAGSKGLVERLSAMPPPP